MIYSKHDENMSDIIYTFSSAIRHKYIIIYDRWYNSLKHLSFQHVTLCVCILLPTYIIYVHTLVNYLKLL